MKIFVLVTTLMFVTNQGYGDEASTSEDVVYNAEIHLNGQTAYNEYREKYDIDATGSYYFRLNRLWWGLELSYNGVKVNQLGLGLKVFHDPLTNSSFRG